MLVLRYIIKCVQIVVWLLEVYRVQVRRGSKTAVTPELENGNDRQNFKKAADNAFNIFFDCVACPYWLACFKYVIADHNRIVLLVCQSHLILQFMVSTSGNNKI